MSPLFQAVNDVSLKKKALIVFILNFLLTIVATACLLYIFVQHSGETTKNIHALLVVILFLLLSVQAAALIYFKSNIIRPLAEMQAASRLMADGHLETLNHIKRADEIGSLGENVNDLAINMQEVLLFTWNHSRITRNLLEKIASDLHFSLDTEQSDSIIKSGIQQDISTMYRNNEELKSIVMSFNYFEIKLEDEKMVSHYQQHPPELTVKRTTKHKRG